MSSIVEVSEADWNAKVANAEQPVVVNFWGPHCVWCKRLDPVYEELAGAYEDRLTFAKLNVAENREAATEWGIMGTPTLKVFCFGREVYEVVGFRPKDKLAEELDRALANAQECLDQSTPLEEA